MSSAVVSTSAALGRPFVFDGESEPEVCLPSSASRAALDRTAGGGCPHINLPHKNPAAKISPASITTASQLEIRPAPEMVSSGIPAIDALTGGLPRGCLTEVCGSASSGRTTLLMAALAAATRRGDFLCVVVDASDTYSTPSPQRPLVWNLIVCCGYAAATISRQKNLHHRATLRLRSGQAPAQRKKELRKTGAPILPRPRREKLSWSLSNGWGFLLGEATFLPSTLLTSSSLWEPAQRKMCGRKIPGGSLNPRLEQVLRATDLLLESGGFGLIVLDLGDLPPQSARRIPLTTWFRFRRAIEHTPTILLVIESSRPSREVARRCCCNWEAQQQMSQPWSSERLKPTACPELAEG